MNNPFSAGDRAALRIDLERRFRTITRTVQIGGRDIELLGPASADELIREDEFLEDERLPYWADLWPSARVLAEDVRTMRLAGQRVLELGCGLGMVAIAAALAGADVTATDYYADALLFASLNAAESTGRMIATRLVDWNALPPDLGKFDVVLASDVLYEHRYAALIAHAITMTLRRGGEAIIADPGRIAVSSFVDEAAARGLVSHPDARPYSEDRIRQTITLHRLRWHTGR